MKLRHWLAFKLMRLASWLLRARLERINVSVEPDEGLPRRWCYRCEGDTLHYMDASLGHWICKNCRWIDHE
jgi:hypothetical protein